MHNNRREKGNMFPLSRFQETLKLQALEEIVNFLYDCLIMMTGLKCYMHITYK